MGFAPSASQILDQIYSLLGKPFNLQNIISPEFVKKFLGEAIPTFPVTCGEEPALSLSRREFEV